MAVKYKFEGIGSTSATLTLALMSSSPLAWFTVGIQGRFTYWLLKWLYMGLASRGLVVLNIGVAKVTTIAEQIEFDGSMDEAFRIINERKGSLSAAEVKAIDDKVISAFRRFATFNTK